MENSIYANEEKQNFQNKQKCFIRFMKHFNCYAHKMYSQQITVMLKSDTITISVWKRMLFLHLHGKS